MSFSSVDITVITMQSIEILAFQFFWGMTVSVIFVKKLEVYLKYFKMKTHGNDTVCTLTIRTACRPS